MIKDSQGQEITEGWITERSSQTNSEITQAGPEVNELWNNF